MRFRSDAQRRAVFAKIKDQVGPTPVPYIPGIAYPGISDTKEEFVPYEAARAIRQMISGGAIPEEKEHIGEYFTEETADLKSTLRLMGGDEDIYGSDLPMMTLGGAPVIDVAFSKIGKNMFAEHTPEKVAYRYVNRRKMDADDLEVFERMKRKPHLIPSKYRKDMTSMIQYRIDPVPIVTPLRYQIERLDETGLDKELGKLDKKEIEDMTPEEIDAEIARLERLEAGR